MIEAAILLVFLCAPLGCVAGFAFGWGIREVRSGQQQATIRDNVRGLGEVRSGLSERRGPVQDDPQAALLDPPEMLTKRAHEKSGYQTYADCRHALELLYEKS